MKVSIIGGGPAGLYCAIAIRQALPAARVKVYEAANETVNSLGLGYVLQGLHLDLLRKLDKQFIDSLFGGQLPPKLLHASVRVDDHIQEKPFELGYTVTRHQLMRYLRAQALACGVRIIEKKIELKHVSRLKSSSDLLIAADGVSSLVRKRYATELDATSTSANIRFCWYFNDSSSIDHKPKFWAVSTEHGVIQMITYPQTDHRQIVIMEMTEACFVDGDFKNKTAEEIARFLSKELSHEREQLHLETGNLPWMPFSQNSVKKLYTDNLAFVGESAFSFHYGFGWGLATAFTMGYILARSLSSHPMPHALQTYHNGAMLALGKPVKKSLEAIQWMEGIDQHFIDTPHAELVDHYLQRHRYRKLLKSQQD